MQEEMVASDDNGTWKLISLLSSKKAIGCKWGFAIKVNFDDSIIRLRACLVAKSYTQTYDDYFDIFFPVTKLVSIRLLSGIHL